MKTASDERCWCEHLKQWHSVAGVCRWCAKMELRRPQFNFTPRHPFATELPEEMRRQAAIAFERAMKGLSDEDNGPEVEVDLPC